MTGFDPKTEEEWQYCIDLGHKAVDEMFDYLKTLRERPLWQPPKVTHNSHMPWEPTQMHAVYEEFRRDIAPYAIGNKHPAFFAFAAGGGTVAGALAEFLMGSLNMPCVLGNTSGIATELEVINWLRQVFSFPTESSGIFLGGSTAANNVALLCSRTSVLGKQINATGARPGECVVISSLEGHDCIRKGMAMDGMGYDNLVQVPVDELSRMRLDLLRDAILQQKLAGKKILCVIASAGTTLTGAIDDLDGVADICQEEGIWMHVDGAIGGLCVLSEQLKGKLRGIERADSIALDFHKWAHTICDCGFALVRNGQFMRDTFSSHEHVHAVCRSGPGFNDVGWWPVDHGPDTSRPFRAFRVWFQFKVYGARAIGEAMEFSCHMARQLVRKVKERRELELLTPEEPDLCIVIFRYVDSLGDAHEDRINAANKHIVFDLQQQGIVFPSFAIFNGKAGIRACLLSHRMQEVDLDNLVENALMFGAQRLSQG